jgi:hypothetical protein
MKRFEGLEQGPRSDPFVPSMLRHTHLPCGAVRKVPPRSLARLVGRMMTLTELARRMRCSKRGTKGADVVAVSIPRPRGRGFGVR